MKRRRDIKLNDSLAAKMELIWEATSSVSISKWQIKGVDKNIGLAGRRRGGDGGTGGWDGRAC